MDAFLAEVRSSEKLLQELQGRLRTVVAENDKSQTDVAGLRREREALGEESHRHEQELAAVLSKTLLQDVRLKKVLEYRTQVKRDLDDAEAELSGVRGRLGDEINEMCSEAGRHLGKFGLNGTFHAKAKQHKLNELAEAKSLTEQLSCRIKTLQQHENTLKLELQKLADTERDIENKRQELHRPQQGRARIHDLQQTLCRLVQDQRDGRHLQQLRADISDSEDETKCLRSAAAAMSSELQRLEQLLWFSNMERMKQRMRATARCPGQYHCTMAGVFGDGVAGGSSPASAKTGPSELARPWPAGPGRTAAPTVSSAAAGRAPAQVHHEGRPGNTEQDDDYEDLDLPEAWSDPEMDPPAASSAHPSDTEAPEVNTAAPAPPSAPVTPPAVPPAPAARAESISGPSAAELAQRRWGARRALMMARRQPGGHSQPPQPPQPAQPPPPPSPAVPVAPPLASVRPQLRPQSARETEASAATHRRDWGRAAAPGRLSYRGPQPSKRAPDFRTGLQKLREQSAAAAAAAAGTPVPQKRVRFSTDPPQEEVLGCDDDMDDFL